MWKQVWRSKKAEHEKSSLFDVDNSSSDFEGIFWQVGNIWGVKTSEEQPHNTVFISGIQLEGVGG